MFSLKLKQNKRFFFPLDILYNQNDNKLLTEGTSTWEYNLFKQLEEFHIDDIKHSTLEIRNYKIIVREMELGKRSGYIPMLNFLS